MNFYFFVSISNRGTPFCAISDHWRWTIWTKERVVQNFKKERFNKFLSLKVEIDHTMSENGHKWNCDRCSKTYKERVVLYNECGIRSFNFKHPWELSNISAFIFLSKYVVSHPFWWKTNFNDESFLNKHFTETFCGL